MSAMIIEKNGTVVELSRRRSHVHPYDFMVGWEVLSRPCPIPGISRCHENNTAVGVLASQHRRHTAPHSSHLNSISRVDIKRPNQRRDR